MELKTATVVKVYRTHVWIDSTMWGERKVMMQHEGTKEPFCYATFCYATFCYATFHYDYRYTSNASTLEAATKLAQSLGAPDPVPTEPPR